jgi:hypothetical protein
MVMHPHDYPKPQAGEPASLKPALASIPNAINHFGGISRSKFYSDILPLLQTVKFGARRFVVVESMDRLIAERARMQCARPLVHDSEAAE